MSVDLTVTALVGSELAPFAWMATIPIALIALGTVFANTFVNRLIARIGHKHVFEAGAVIAICGGISSFCAVWFHNFPLLCVGTFAVGIYQAASNYYRYAAADLNPGKKDRAVSVVLSAGVIAAIVGPLLATWAEGLFPVHYAGSYLIVSVLGILALATVAMFPADQQIGSTRQPVGSAQKVGLLELLRRPRFLLGIALGFTVCCAMTMIMAGAPLVMEHVLHESDGTRMQAMQLHMLGMYLPMALIPLLNSKKRSHTVFVSLALGLGLASCVLGLGQNAPLVAMALLGIAVAWALGYNEGTVLLVSSYSADEVASARGKGEFFLVCGQVIGSLLAGSVIEFLGWRTMLAILTLLFVLTSGIAVNSRKAIA
ncbi:MFS transporter [Bifidobacterium longum]|nr:MFS transporter [Bifidobacterium longum]